MEGRHYVPLPYEQRMNSSIEKKSLVELDLAAAEYRACYCLSHIILVAELPFENKDPRPLFHLQITRSQDN